LNEDFSVGNPESWLEGSEEDFTVGNSEVELGTELGKPLNAVVNITVGDSLPHNPHDFIHACLTLSQLQYFFSPGILLNRARSSHDLFT